VQAKGGSLFERSMVHPDYNDFAPRFGFAYRLGNKTVLRGGYGIGFVHFNRLASAELLATNYPFVTRATVTQSSTGTVDGKTVTLNDRRPYQAFGTISTVLPAGFSTYHSLQVKVEHRATRSLNLLNAFTWSKAIDNASQVLEEPNGSTGTPQNIHNVNADKGI